MGHGIDIAVSRPLAGEPAAGAGAGAEACLLS
jgi:hypothetical protein